MSPHYSTRTSSTYDDIATTSKPTTEKIDIASTSDAILPAPVVQFSPTGTRGFGRERHIRVKESATRSLKTQWDRMLRKFGAGTAPDASSVDLDTESVAETSVAHGYYKPERGRLEDSEEVDEVVVDREWGEDVHSTSVHSGHGEKSGGSGQHGQTSGEDVESMAVLHDDADSRCAISPILAYLRWRLWANIMGFFVTQFIDDKSEEQYRRENWFLRKVCFHSICYLCQS